MMKPFFSIIVVSFNAEKLIEETIRSVLMQDFADFEIVVKDACSTDMTLDKIPKDDRIFTYVSKDSGIYFGMNEAISHAKGKYLLFLNCGDVLAAPDILSTIYETAKTKDEKITVIYGDYSRDGIRAKQPSVLSKFYLYRTPLCHQTVFFSNALFKQFGLYDTQYRILADYDFTLKTFLGNAEYIYCPTVVSNYLGGGVSESKQGIEIKTRERKKICHIYFSNNEQKKYSFLLKLSMRKFRQKIVVSSPQLIRRLYRGLVNIINR
ncbi:MAG: glycosyltransferase [Clostridia bacterium]|nr:glycosyltransferase [Clostridia bacterium]